jgi:hypothetical protein
MHPFVENTLEVAGRPNIIEPIEMKKLTKILIINP